MRTTVRHRWILWWILTGFFATVSISAQAHSAPAAASIPPTNASTDAAPPAETLRLGFVHGGPLNFTSAFAADPDSVLVSRLLGLTLRQAAESYAQTSRSDGTSSLLIHLRDGLLWSDGSRLSANDWADAFRQVYLVTAARSVFYEKLAPLSIISVEAPDDRTILLVSAHLLSALQLQAISEVTPLPMGLFFQWRGLGQKGSLGTGMRAPAQYRQFQFLDSKPSALVSLGPYCVHSLVPGLSVVLVPNIYWRSADGAAASVPALLPTLSFVCLRGVAAAVQAFLHGDLDVLPLEDESPQLASQSVPPSQPAFRPRLRDWEPATHWLCLVVNPRFIEDKPWIATVLQSTDGNQAPLKHVSIKLEVLFDHSRADRQQEIKSLGTSVSVQGITLVGRPSTLNDMLATLKWGGNWQAMLLQIDQSDVADATSRLQLIGITTPAPLVIPLAQALRYLWTQPNSAPVPPVVAQSLLAYASFLY